MAIKPKVKTIDAHLPRANLSIKERVYRDRESIAVITVCLWSVASILY